VFAIHGRGLSRDYVGNLLLVSSIEALATTRLYELWFEQKFANDRIAVRAGQLAADTEFINSAYAGVFINSSFGWPAINATDLPSGGPAPPLAVPGVRVRAKLTDQITLLAALFDGDPAGPGADDAQSRNRYGLNFRLSDPPLAIAEVQYNYGTAKDASVLPGTVKFGAWGHGGLFDDQRSTPAGQSLADPAGSGIAAQHRGDFGLYTVFEQALYQFGGAKERDIGIFARVSGSPSDRNLIDLYADGGVTFNGPFASRPDDKFGLGVAVARISGAARALDQDFQVFTGVPRAIRDYEAVFAATYWAAIRDGWVIHPSVQYVRHPNGGAFNPANPTGGAPLKDALVFVLRSIARF
jgi:porin